MSNLSVPGATLGNVASSLTDTDRELIELASKWFRHEGVRASRFAELCGSPVQGWQRVNRLIELREAIEEFPAECRRLRTIRDARLASRFGQRSA